MRDYQADERVPGSVYRVVRQIGAGGMGTVYEVEDTTIGKRYVLKTLHPQLGSRGDLARRMQNEARALARLAHPHIVEVITAGITADELRLPYFVMERLNGHPLRTVIQKNGRLELPHAYNIALELLSALDYAHRGGVIHRDVKPDNIFLHRGPSGGQTTTKLLDFGIMSLLDVVSRETGGRFLGTLRYAAPEQLRGERPTPHMDLYCAGLVLYEMIAGRGPFDDEGDSRQVAAAHLKAPPPPLSRFAPVPPELDVIMASALAKSPADRPRDAASFAAVLHGLRRLFGVPPEMDIVGLSPTASAVIDSVPGAGLVSLRQATPGAQVVISPVPVAPMTVAEGAAARRAELPTTTAVGMAPPTAGGSSGTPTATTPDDVDRDASTQTFRSVSDRSPSHGTELLDAETTTTPLAMASEDMMLGGEDGKGNRVGEGQAPVRRSRWGNRRRSHLAVIVTGGALLVVVALVSVVSVAHRSSDASSEPSLVPSSAPTSSSVASAPPATAEIGPAAAEQTSGDLAAAAPIADTPAPAPSASAESPKPRTPPEGTAKAARPSSPQHAVERPGPGF
jgi:serine/threonine protein kinase